MQSVGGLIYETQLRVQQMRKHMQWCLPCQILDVQSLLPNKRVVVLPAYPQLTQKLKLVPLSFRLVN